MSKPAERYLKNKGATATEAKDWAQEYMAGLRNENGELVNHTNAYIGLDDDLQRMIGRGASLEEIKWLPEGTVVGLGKGKALKKPTRVAVLDLGWANGVGVLHRSERQELPLVRRLRAFANPNERFEPVVRVGGKKVPILGQTGMTALTLNVTKCECSPKDLAVLDADPRMVRFLPVEMRE